MVKPKACRKHELVCKLILPIGTKDDRFEKWSPNWDGPYRIKECFPWKAYIIETLEGQQFPKAFNRKYLKKYLISQIFG